MTTSLPPSFVDPVLAELAGAPAGLGLSADTVLLALLVGLMFFLLSSVMKLRAEVAGLRATPAASAVPLPAALPTAVQSANAGPSSEEIAAIAAAVHVLLGPKAEVVGIVPVVPDEWQVWSREGRRQVFMSHRVR
jgi:hypothetical protein